MALPQKTSRRSSIRKVVDARYVRNLLKTGETFTLTITMCRDKYAPSYVSPAIVGSDELGTFKFSSDSLSTYLGAVLGSWLQPRNERNGDE